jgi:hypothetical protein
MVLSSYPVRKGKGLSMYPVKKGKGLSAYPVRKCKGKGLSTYPVKTADAQVFAGGWRRVWRPARHSGLKCVSFGTKLN